MKHLAFALLVFACVSAAPSPPSPAVGDIVRDYAKLQRMTKEAHRVPMTFSGLCTYSAAAAPQSPHANASLHIFMNPDARTAFEKSQPYPIGSVVVKEKHLSTTDKVELGGMIKRKASNPSNLEDWEFFYSDSKQNLAPANSLQSCKDCHANASKKDFVFGDWAKPQPSAVNKP